MSLKLEKGIELVDENEDYSYYDELITPAATATTASTPASRDPHVKLKRRLPSDDLFSEQRSEGADEAMNFTMGSAMDQMSITLPRRQYTKLEVVEASEINTLLHWHHIFVLIGIIYTVIGIVLMNTVYAQVWYTQWEYGWKYDLRRFVPPRWVNWFSQIVSIPMFLYILLLFIGFTIRIAQLQVRSRTKEQIWIIFLLLSMVFYLNPFRSIVKIHDVMLYQLQPWRQWRSNDWCGIALKLCDVLQMSGFTATTVFYVWASIHSYRMLDTKITYMFYVPKVVILALYVASKIVVNLSYNIIPSELCFTNFIAMLSIYSTAQLWYPPGVWFASLTFAFEVILVSYIFWEYRCTRRVLQNSDYLKYRTQQIGFRFFIYHNLTFYVAYITLYIFLLTALPNGINVFVLRIAGQRMSLFKLHDLQFGIQLMLLAYVTVETYVNLPADSLGLLVCFYFPYLFFNRQGQDRQQQRNSNSITRNIYNSSYTPHSSSKKMVHLEPITYRKREPPSIHGIVCDLRVNCFVMQTHVTLFNFAWLVYYWNTPKVDNFQLTQDVFKFFIADYIADDLTDTHVLVVNGEDRIIIAFKGTTSSKNLKTDVNMFYSNARALLPTQLEDDPDNNVDLNSADSANIAKDVLATSHWKRAKIHKGFAVAYAAVAKHVVSVVRKLQREKRRPVFLTGHSLGGALATLCSLDLRLCLRMTDKEIFVSTFGAPRVGNRHFHTVYNECVQIHWRIVVGPDVVAKLPKMGYRHVGKKVLITVDGDLFIDPNSLELNMWSGDVASILYHRKASYLLAMRAWCERHHGDEYVPEFWPFPVSKDDTRRFQHAMVRSGFTASPRSGPSSKHARIRELDAMVEALGNTLDVNEVIMQKWAKLARLVLSQSKDDLAEEQL